MRTSSHWNNVYNILSAYQWVAAALAAGVSVLLKIDASKWANNPSVPEALKTLAWIIERSKNNAWWMIGFFSASGAGARFACRQIGPPWVWDHVHFLLDKFRELIFEGESGENHHHRVTLFKRVRFVWARCWDWRGFLIPVERSGYSSMRSSVVFCVPDDADKAEGIAGATWASKQIVKIETMPEFWNHSKDKAPYNKKLEEYAKGGRVDLKWLRARTDTMRSRSFWGVPVEVKGQIWGVIVIDSRSPTFKNPSAIDQFWKTAGKYFSKLLEKA